MSRRRRTKCLLWKGAVDAKGYGRIWHGGKWKLVHRLVWEKAYWPLSSSAEWVLHECDNPLCIRVSHLFPGNVDINNYDKALKGRARSGHNGGGFKGGKRKLSPEIVRRIRKSSLTHAALARHYGVSAVNILLVRARKIWRSA